MSEKMWNNNGKNGDHFKNKTSCQKSILRQNILLGIIQIKVTNLKVISKNLIFNLTIKEL